MQKYASSYTFSGKLHALPFRVVRLSDRTLTVYRRRGRLYLDSKRTYKYTWNSRRQRTTMRERRKGEEDTTGKGQLCGTSDAHFFSSAGCARTRLISFDLTGT